MTLFFKKCCKEQCCSPGLSESRRASRRGCISAMVVERSVVEMVLERGETRHDVVVNGLKEIALCGKVRGFALL
jgi:hypothetical protein